MKTAVRLGPISPITGCPVWLLREFRHFMRLLLLNINYLRHYFLSKPCRKKLWILNTLPKGGNLHLQYTTCDMYFL